MGRRVITQTVHILTRDIVNPTHAFRDKRRSESWYDVEVFTKGRRFIVIKRDVEAEFGNVLFNTALPKDKPYRLMVDVAADVSRHEAAPSSPYGEIHMWKECFTPGSDIADVEFWNQRDADDMTATTAERRRGQAQVALQKMFMEALSEPIHDYRSTFLHPFGWGRVDPEDILHHLYETGVISLDVLKSAITDFEAKDKS